MDRGDEVINTNLSFICFPGLKSGFSKLILIILYSKNPLYLEPHKNRMTQGQTSRPFIIYRTKRFILGFLLLSGIGSPVTAGDISWPAGVRMDTVNAYFDAQVHGHYVYRGQDMVGFIAPEIWYNADAPADGSGPFITEFYPSGNKDTLPVLKEAVQWMTEAINAYYAPVSIGKWKSLNVMPPKVKLEYPSAWTYRLDKYPIFQSKPLSENKLVLLKTEGQNKSEVIQVIRTPNTAKLSLQQFMDQTAMMNKAINFITHPPADTIIGSLAFKTLEHDFMGQMQLRHFWYANAEELIYISCGLLKDERLRYPEVVAQIIRSITW